MLLRYRLGLVSWARFHTFFEFFEVDSIQGGGGKNISLLMKSLAFASPFMNIIYMARNYSRRGLTILKAPPNYSVPDLQPFILLKENLHLQLGMIQWQPMFETTKSLEAKKPLLLPKQTPPAQERRESGKDDNWPIRGAIAKAS